MCGFGIIVTVERLCYFPAAQGGESGLDCGAKEAQEAAAMMTLAMAEVNQAVRLLTQEKEQVSACREP